MVGGTVLRNTTSRLATPNVTTKRDHSGHTTQTVIATCLDVVQKGRLWHDLIPQ